MKSEEMTTIKNLLESICPAIDTNKKELIAGVIIGMAITAKAEAGTQPT